MPPLIAASWAACKTTPHVVAYTSVDQVFSEPVFRGFGGGHNSTVRAVFDTEETKSTGVLNRILAERERPQADVFWSGDPVRALVLVDEGLAEPYVSPQAARIPAQFKDPRGRWTGCAARARVLLVNRDLVDRGAGPTSVLDLADSRWKGRAAMANPLFGTTTMHVAAWFAHWGDTEAKGFLQRIRANETRIAASNGDVKRLVSAGEVAFGVTDTDDAHAAVGGGANVEIVYPDQDDLGTLIMPTTVVLIKGGPSPKLGKELIDYLLSARSEARMAAAAAHMPLRDDVQTPPSVRSVVDLRAMEVDYAEVARRMGGLQPWLRTWVGV